jgi:hypothetical protein
MNFVYQFKTVITWEVCGHHEINSSLILQIYASKSVSLKISFIKSKTLGIERHYLKKTIDNLMRNNILN